MSIFIFNHLLFKGDSYSHEEAGVSFDIGNTVIYLFLSISIGRLDKSKQMMSCHHALNDYIYLYVLIVYVIIVYVISKPHYSGPFGEGKIVGCTC